MDKRFIVIGASLGGLAAIKELLSGISSSFRIPMAIVLHREEDSPSDLLVSVLSKEGQIKVVEAEDKMEIQKSRCYLAPANYHLLVEGDHFALSTEEKVNFARPAIDVLMESAADTYQSNLIGILLTGNSIDGAKGLKEIKDQGGLTIVQDPQEASASLMPESAIQTGKPDYVLPIAKIKTLLLDLEKKEAS